MTAPQTDRYTYRAANAMPNDETDITTMTVQQIAAARKVSQRYAYTLLRRASAEKQSANIPTNQRDLVLSTLASNPSIKNTAMLSDAIHAAGSKLPPHDVTKVVWSLQKSRYVRFRERANGMLYAIKLTNEGWRAARGIGLPAKEVVEVEEVEVEVTNVGPDQQEQAHDIVAEHVAKVAASTSSLAAKAASLQETVQAREVYRNAPWAESGMGDFPAISAIREKARKAKKITAAAALLEEAGEDDTALTLMSKTEFTPLEQEVIEILRFFKEIE